MPQGLQVFDSTGTVWLDLTTRVGKVYGSIPILGNGSVTIPDLGGGTLFYFYADTSTNQNKPRFTVSGNTVSWVFVSGWGSNSSGILFYGAY